MRMISIGGTPTVQEFLADPAVFAGFNEQMAILGKNPAKDGELLPTIAVREDLQRIRWIEPNNIELRYGCFEVGPVLIPYLAVGIGNCRGDEVFGVSEICLNYFSYGADELFDLLTSERSMQVLLYGDKPKWQRALILPPHARDPLLAAFFQEVATELENLEPWTIEQYVAAKSRLNAQLEVLEIWQCMLPLQMQRFANDGTLAPVQLSARPNTDAKRARHREIIETNGSKLATFARQRFKEEERGFVFVEVGRTGDLKIEYRALKNLDEDELDELGDVITMVQEYDPTTQMIVTIDEDQDSDETSTYRLLIPDGC